MKFFKKAICIIAAFSLLPVCNVNATAKQEGKDISKFTINSKLKLSKAKIEKKDGYTITTITDNEELKNPDVLAGAEVPEGYKLIEVKIGKSDFTMQQDEGLKTGNPVINSIPPPMYIYYGKNPVINPIECYFPDNPNYSDWFDGPCTVNISEQ